MSNKLRNRFLALLLLLAFVAVGFLYFFNWVVQRPFAIIVFVADGMNAGALTAARIYAGGAERPLRLEQFPNLALLRNHANDYAVPSAASAGTAIATGRKGNNRSLGIDPSGKPLENLLEAARAAGRATGLVSNVSIVGVGAAAFFAETPDAGDRSGIAAKLVEGFAPDVIIGGGEAEFLPDIQGGLRVDGRDLTLEMRRKGFDIARTKLELDNTPPWRGPRVFALLSRGDMEFSAVVKDRASQPSLSEMVQSAIQFLQFNRRGYVLVVDVGLIEKAARANQAERMLQEIGELDAAVQTAVDYAGKDAMVLVLGKQSVGGLRMNGYPFRSDKGVATVGVTAQGIPAVTWSTGPTGPQPPSESAATPPVSVTSSDVAAAFAPSAENVAEDTIALATGQNTERVRGFLDNTAIFQILHDNL